MKKIYKKEENHQFFSSLISNTVDFAFSLNVWRVLIIINVLFAAEANTKRGTARESQYEKKRCVIADYGEQIAS